MLRRGLISLVLIIFPLIVIASTDELPLAMTLSAVKSSYIFEEAIHAHLGLRNTGRQPLKIDHTWLREGRFEVKENSEDWKRCSVERREEFTKRFVVEPVRIAPSEEIGNEIRLDEYCKLSSAIRYEIRFVYEGVPYPSGHPNHSVWSGRVESNPIGIEIREPVGVDKQANEFLKVCYSHALGIPRDASIQIDGQCRSQLLNQYPSSVYAAYIYAGEFESWKFSQSPSILFDLLQKPDYPPGGFARGCDGQPIPDSKGGYQWLSGKGWLQNIINQGKPILQAHGDDSYLGPRLRMGLALANIGVGNYESARALFADLAKKAPLSDLAPRANEYLQAMKKAGLVP